MTEYVALLRGISPSYPNMTGKHLRGVCESLGLQEVRSVVGSGNLVFKTDKADSQKLEFLLEGAWPKELGFKSLTIVKTREEIQKLIDHDSFRGMVHGPSSYLMVTFLKNPMNPRFSIPYQPSGKPYKIIDYYEGAIFSVTNNIDVKTSDLMTWLEKEFGKDITSRSWNTVQRIHKTLLDYDN